MSWSHKMHALLGRTGRLCITCLNFMRKKTTGEPRLLNFARFKMSSKRLGASLAERRTSPSGSRQVLEHLLYRGGSCSSSSLVEAMIVEMMITTIIFWLFTFICEVWVKLAADRRQLDFFRDIATYCLTLWTLIPTSKRVRWLSGPAIASHSLAPAYEKYWKLGL